VTGGASYNLGLSQRRAAAASPATANVLGVLVFVLTVIVVPPARLSAALQIYEDRRATALAERVRTALASLAGQPGGDPT
jgi:hypothetical protein